jgi:DNA-damage-inducible protein J
MAATAFVRTRIDEGLRDEAAVLAEMGLTRIVRDKPLPLELKIPNAATKVAMEEARTLIKASAALDQKARQPKRAAPAQD